MPSTTNLPADIANALHIASMPLTTNLPTDIANALIRHPCRKTRVISDDNANALMLLKTPNQIDKTRNGTILF
jgi:hypothetical protein